MRHRSKRYKECLKLIGSGEPSTLSEAVKTLKSFPAAKYDESVELNFRLGIKPDQADEMVRGVTTLPHGSGKQLRVICFAKGEAQKEAERAGAEYVGVEEYVKKIEGGWLDFDAVVAHPEVMREISKLGKILGPRGLMPTPKTGTVTTDVAKAIREIKAGRVEFKSDKTSGAHVMFGKRSFSEEVLVDNARAVIKAVVSAKPSASKGDYLRSVYLSSSQSPAIRLKSSSLSVQER